MRRLAVRHGGASAAGARRGAPATTGAGRVAVTIRIALSSAPRASAAVGRDLRELHQIARRQPALDLAEHQLAGRRGAAARRPARRWSAPANRSRSARPGTRGSPPTPRSRTAGCRRSRGSRRRPGDRAAPARSRARGAAAVPGARRAARAACARSKQRDQRAQRRRQQRPRRCRAAAVLLHHRHRRRRVLQRRLGLVGDQAGDLDRDRRRCAPSAPRRAGRGR